MNVFQEHTQEKKHGQTKMQKMREFVMFWKQKNWKKAFFQFCVVMACLLFLLGGVFILWILSDIPNAEDLRNLNLAESSIIYDDEGNEVLYNIYGEENRKYVSIGDISSHMGNAILAAEDADFYTHKGVDLMGMLRSVYLLIKTGEIRGGGSTLTQQVAKNTLLKKERNIFEKYVRKLKEIYLSFRIEKNFSKDEILELYLNKISFGNNSFGIEQASKTYFGKKAKDLTLAESAVLASLPQAPSRWSPYGPRKTSELDITLEALKEQKINTEEEFWKLKTDDFSPISQGLLGKNISIAEETSIYAEGRADYVLGQMKEKRFISGLEYTNTQSQLQNIEFKTYRAEIKAPHFVFYVRELLEEELGKEVLEQSGLRIYTTLDFDLQQKAEELIEKNAESNQAYDISNIALVSAEPSTGYIKAMVGSRDYWSEEIDGKVNVILQKRQPGSSFKPIAYAAGFLKGLSPATVLFDVKTRFGRTIPQNFDGRFRGPVSLRKALGNSLNIPALKVGIIAGTGVYDLAQKMGLGLLRDADFYGSSIALGTGETRPLDMLQAYSIFAMGGKKVPMTPILWVEDRHGNIVLDNREVKAEPEEILDEQTAYLITHVLSDSKARGAGWNSRLQLSGRKNAIKTGTSNGVDAKTGVKYPNDTWTIGYTPDLVTTVWAGNNRGLIKSHKASGWQNAALTWKEFMEYAHTNLPVKDFVRPEGIKVVAVDRFSGKLPAEDLADEFIVTEIFRSENTPTEVGKSLTFIEIDTVSEKLPTEFTPDSAKEKRAMLSFHSYRPNDPTWEEPVQKWLTGNSSEFLAKLGAHNFITKIPEDYDDVHTEATSAQKPEMSLLTPINFGVVSPPFVNIFPEIKAPNGMKYLEIYWDSELKTTIKSSPWQGVINIGAPEKGSVHSLKVVAIDQLYYTDEADIEIKIGTDDSPPSISFLFPKNGEEIPGGTTHTLRVSAVDARSSVDKVIFSLNGKQISVAQNSPFETEWLAPNTAINYTLTAKAFDTAGNVSEQSIDFSTRKGSGVNTFGVLLPQNNTSVVSPVYITAGITDDIAQNFSSLEIWQKYSDGRPKILKTFPGPVPATRTFSLVWESSAGNFEIWAKAKLSSGGTQISPKSRIEVK